MKSAKSPRMSMPPHRGRSSRSVEGHGKTESPPGAGQSEEQLERRATPIEKPSTPSTASPLIHSQTSKVLAQESGPGDLEAMRRRMSEALAHKQQLKAASSSSLSTGSKSRDEPRDVPLRPPAPVESSSDESVNTVTLSTDSAKTVKAAFDETPDTAKTPSYPFPRMQPRVNRGASQLSAPSVKPFPLQSSTDEPVLSKEEMFSPQMPEGPRSDFSTPLGRASVGPGIPEDPNFPTPDLYDMILILNAEPGLDMWWTNVTEVLSEAYGAERASLAVPGDITDLENVPWGQKATYHLAGSDSGGTSSVDSVPMSEADIRAGRRSETSRGPVEAAAGLPPRPPLQTRHSISGVVPETVSRGPRPRPPGPVRAHSTVTGPHEEQRPSAGSPRLTKQSSPSTPLPPPQSISEFETSAVKGQYDSSMVSSSLSASSALRCHVHRSLQPLEAEHDPPLVRTGVSALFGKRKPVVLTRAYLGDAPRHSPYPMGAPTKDEKRAPLGHRPPETGRTSRPLRTFDEYEQPEPSPWSQSPSPSPAARPDPTESPFFAQPASIDETAFEQSPPAYDYAVTANQSLSAIGTDLSKTLIHIPLIQAVPSRGALASTLRFPIAILSFLSPLNPYPRNLRHSLSTLLPHLASSYSLAAQYSALQDRLRGSPRHRHGASFGLGGTFSDEGSELELVAELSGQIAQDQNKSKQSSYRGSISSVSDRPIYSQSTPGSTTGTPLLDHLGFNTGFQTTPGRSGADMVDSYFTAKRHRSSHQPLTPELHPGVDDWPEHTRRSVERPPTSGSKAPARKTACKSQGGEPVTPGATRVPSTTSDRDLGDHRVDTAFRRRHSQTKDDGERPLPELISSLMLNAVPLQLFLAKPGTGDLVWTNRKFDAFRSQGEGRVRDPWQNVHSADRNGLIKLWNEALRSGSQFTHYVRVKRFNSDSDFRWFVFRASTLLSNSGRLLYWIGSFLDVHEQYIKNLEASEREALMARDAKIRALADAIPQILFEAVEGEGIVAVNQQWHAFSGQTLDDARGLGFARHVHRDDLHKCGILSPTDIPAIARSRSTSVLSDARSSPSSNQPAEPLSPHLSLDSMINQGSVTVEKDENGRLSYLTEIRLRSKGGEYRWFLVRLVRVESALINSGQASWYGTCTDIEIRKALERELSQANKKVHSEMESKTKFFANMSHEIRTPLNGILGSMPWLVESALDHDQRRTVDTIQNSANNLRELVDNILDVTKVEVGKMTLVPKWFHVRTLCEEVVDTVSSRAIERGLELNYSLDARVPSAVKGDPFRVRQVLLNLIGNSVKFTEQGEVYMRCTLRDDPETDSGGRRANTALLTFDVIDTGRGLNESDLQRLFKQFGQIGAGTNHDAGSGLGLFLSKQLVEMHGGELSVKSQPGEGSTFSFYVRVEVAPPGSELSSPLSGRPGSHRHSVSVESSRSRSHSKMPTMATAKGMGVGQTDGLITTPSLSRFVSSPEQLSASSGGAPAVASSAATSPPIISPKSATSGSVRSISGHGGGGGSASSPSPQVPTPESVAPREVGTASRERPLTADKSGVVLPAMRPWKSDLDDGRLMSEVAAHPATYSIIVICPAEHARAAIKQHIDLVVPHQIAANVTTIPDIGALLDLMHGPAPPTFTHIVLDIPASSDLMLFMRQMEHFTAPVIPALVIITDHYQKRDILEEFTTLTSSGRKAFLIHKPVKPSVFAMIFDPAQLRYFSKDRIREVAQSSSDDFNNIANLVKQTIGHKGHRVLLVEDSDVNRMVILRYLRKVALENESAKDGQECVDMVLSRPHGYYSLVICDIQMPKKNGYEACAEIRQWETSNGHRPLPIMALTANAMPEERAAAAAAGFTDYLTKPVEFNLLGTMMMALLDPKARHTFLRDRGAES